jgi:putative ABC transport system permease protein
MLGVEPGRPGDVPVFEGRTFSTDLAREVVLDRSTVRRSGLKVGDRITIRVTQGDKDQFYDLTVVGITDSRQYSLQPAIFVPYFTWDRVRPKSQSEVNLNGTSTGSTTDVIAVKVQDPLQLEAVRQHLVGEIANVEVATIPQAIVNIPGYTPQQSTIRTMAIFTLLIGILVIGGFFQIQVLQKVAQIGVLKAIGAANPVVGMAAILQITLITIVGVAIGGLGSFLLSLSFPPTTPIVFNGQQTVLAILALLVIGPAGGLVSIRYAIRIEPLKALGLSS